MTVMEREIEFALSDHSSYLTYSWYMTVTTKNSVNVFFGQMLTVRSTRS